MFTFHNRFDIGQRYECEIPCILTGPGKHQTPTGFARGRVAPHLKMLHTYSTDGASSLQETQVWGTICGNDAGEHFKGRPQPVYRPVAEVS
jgi:hypothetical protein